LRSGDACLLRHSPSAVPRQLELSAPRRGWSVVSLSVSLARRLLAPAGVSTLGDCTDPCGLAACVGSCRLARSPCHAEGRGFESHHPLLNKAPEIGAFVSRQAMPVTGAIWSAWTRTFWLGPRLRVSTEKRLANSRGRETALSSQ
jgi:hypothetical protein